MATLTQKRKDIASPVWLLLAASLTLLGIAAYVVQLRQGIGATHLSNVSPWGVYIAGFIFFMGLSNVGVFFSVPKSQIRRGDCHC